MKIHYQTKVFFWNHIVLIFLRIGGSLDPSSSRGLGTSTETLPDYRAKVWGEEMKGECSRLFLFSAARLRMQRISLECKL